jgi:putative permease
MQLVKDWFRHYLSNPQVVILVIMLVGLLIIVMAMGHMLAPVLASLVIAYLLEGVVVALERRGFARLPAVISVFLLFMAFILLMFFGLLPLLSRQASQLFAELPAMLGQIQANLLTLPQRSELATFGRAIVSESLSSVVGLITLLVYLILVPLLVFFFMKDKDKLVEWFLHYLPKDHALVARVWDDVDRQIGNYVRGKFLEILIVWWVTFVAFVILEINFTMLLAVVVGVSVLVPYIGAAVATIPVAVVAYFQWGLGPDFAYLLAAYLVIQALDGNALVPILFSEVVNLHPVAIIVAVLVFGGFWGFWGVFFAIPLGTVVQAVLHAWPGPRTLELDEAGT